MLPSLPSPHQLLGRAQREVSRGVGRTRNGARLLLGADRPTPGSTPKDVVWSRGKVELWRYTPDEVTQARPLFIVHSLVTRSFAFDLAPGNSFVEFMASNPSV